MDSKSFCYWLQGLFEIGNPKQLDETQTRIIKQHLGLVFFHEIDPSYSDNPEVQSQMNDIHDGKIEVKPPKFQGFGEDEDGNKYRC